MGGLGLAGADEFIIITLPAHAGTQAYAADGATTMMAALYLRLRMCWQHFPSWPWHPPLPLLLLLYLSVRQPFRVDEATAVDGVHQAQGIKAVVTGQGAVQVLQGALAGEVQAGLAAVTL